MTCANCGGALYSGQSFCQRCGRAATPAAPAPATSAPNSLSPTFEVQEPAGGRAPFASPPTSRLAKHLPILGMSWMVLSCLRLIPAVAMLFFRQAGFPFLPMPVRTFLVPFLGALGTFLAVTALVGILLGWGLLDRQPWARLLAIVVGCLKLIDFPLGTALGIYTLWVLASPCGEEEYQRLARAY